jgi:hypothetical protein
MALMTNDQRISVSKDFQALHEADETFGCLKGDIKAAIDAADAWVNSNLTDYNSALPAAARTALNARQKARLLVYVLNERFKLGI